MSRRGNWPDDRAAGPDGEKASPPPPRWQPPNAPIRYSLHVRVPAPRPSCRDPFEVPPCRFGTHADGKSDGHGAHPGRGPAERRAGRFRHAAGEINVQLPIHDNLTQARTTFVTHLECSLHGDRYPADQVHGLSKAGKPLLVRYDLEAIERSVTRRELSERPADMWRYREFLPVRRAANIVSLGESHTPLIPVPSLRTGSGEVLIKDEGRLPTGSFKARGLCMAVSMAKELGLRRLAMPTNGNAGAALAAYAARAGMEAYVFCPEDTPETNVREIAAQGARVWRVNGLINDCGRLVAEGKEAMGWFDLSTLKEPYRIEGKKTMGLELADQFGWDVPDVIFYPTGGGTGLIGMWKAFRELQSIGWLGMRLPRMVAVQASGCAPIVRAFEQGTEFAELWENAHTVASGIRVPAAIGDFLILRAVRDSGGFAIAVDDEAILAARDEIGKREGVLLCPEGAATVAAYRKALAEGRVTPQETAVLFNCASGLKYPLPDVSGQLDCRQPVDWGRLIDAGT
ncbi:MAG: threonine synthase [Planctomycetota bacterium]|nr:MAG: threonine synthase [Planctomycetota bacterium]